MPEAVKVLKVKTVSPEFADGSVLRNLNAKLPALLKNRERTDRYRPSGEICGRLGTGSIKIS